MTHYCESEKSDRGLLDQDRIEESKKEFLGSSHEEWDRSDKMSSRVRVWIQKKRKK